MARQAFEAKVIANAKKEPKNLYKYIRSQQQVKAVIGPLDNGNGQLTEDDHQAAEVLHRFFQSVFVREDIEYVPEFPDKVTNENSISEIVLRQSEVLAELHQLNLDKAAGPDGVPTIVLKKCAIQLAHPFTVLFQKILDYGKIPND